MRKMIVKEKGIERNASHIPWEQIEGISTSFFFRHLFLRLKNGKKYPLPHKEEELSTFVLSFYQIWKNKDPEQAKKNAFDYVEPPKSTAYLLLIISICFFLLLSVLLFQESWTQYACSQALKRTPETSVVEILNLKKKKKGNFLVRLKFQTVDGKEFIGERLTVRSYEPGKDPKLFSVTYAKEAPHCWVLNENIMLPKINWLHRSYNTLFNFLVGLVFFIAGILGTITGIERLRQKHPNAKEIKKLFSLNI